MFKPSPILGARLRLTTKQVNGGYYKGNRTGSMGAHDSYGGYLIDYRKVRHFNCPDLTDFPLTPFVTQQMEPTKRTQTRSDGSTFTPKVVDGMEYLQHWRRANPEEYNEVLEYQRKDELALEDRQALDEEGSSQDEPALSNGRSSPVRTKPEKETGPPVA